MGPLEKSRVWIRRVQLFGGRSLFSLSEVAEMKLGQAAVTGGERHWIHDGLACARRNRVRAGIGTKGRGSGKSCMRWSV